jgi:molybdopterin-guanine dinucleotide biosynthesis protein B
MTFTASCRQLVVLTSDAKDMGKTALGTIVVSAAKSWGLNVVAIKHVHHGVDYRVKDTGRYLEAGADTVIAIGPSEHMVVKPRPLHLDEAIKLALREGADLIVVEGFKTQLDALRGFGACHVHISFSSIAVAAGNSTIRVEGTENALRAVLDLVRAGRCCIRMDMS